MSRPLRRRAMRPPRRAPRRRLRPGRRRPRFRPLGRFAYPLVVPDSTVCKIKWTSATNPTPAIIINQSFVMNGVYDPDLTAPVSTQPVGFDEWMGFYERYEVLGCLIEATVYNNSTSGLPIVHAMMPSMDQTPPTNPFIMMQQAHAVDGVSSGANGVPCCVLTKYMDVKAFIGRTTASINYTGSDSTNPANRTYFHVQSESADFSRTIDITVQVEMTFDVRFYKRRTLGQS
jgi:hypothetical protein